MLKDDKKPMRNPKIAIYMSCYNHEAFVAEAIGSILNQSYENWELHVVNDGSTDRSGEVISSFADERIHYYPFEKNTRFIGASNFLQNLISELDVAYITILASDDMWKKDKLKKQVELLEAHPEYKSCFTWDELIFCNEHDVYEGRETYSHVQNRSRYEWIAQFFLGGNCLNACSMLMKKDVFYELGRMNEHYIQLGDLRLWLKLACRYPFYLIEEPLTDYRRHETNLSTPSFVNDLRSINENYKIISDAIRELDGVTFRRAFYQTMPFVFCDTKEELLAAKFFFMAGLRLNQSKQIAVDLYYENCENEDFTALLEANYHFGPREFIEFTGRAGLQLCFLPKDFLEETFQLEETNGQFSIGFVLLNALSVNLVNAESIHWFSYATLLELYNGVGQIENEKKKVDKIASHLNEIRLQRSSAKKSRNIFFFIAKDAPFDVEAFVKEIDDKGTDEYGVCFIPTRQSFFREEQMPAPVTFENSKITYIDLINEKEKCLYFLDELGLEADVIYFVDCIAPEYECLKMISGYSLGVELNQIVKVETQEDLEQGRQTGAHIFHELIPYMG